MPNKDWYWDQFTVKNKEGRLDLSDRQTSAIRNNEKFDDTQSLQYETRFIDDLYGTKDAMNYYRDKSYGLNTETAPRDDGTYGGVLGEHAEDFRDGVTWGLDLVRDWTGKEDLKVGSTEHYQHQTRGKVNWAHYYNDNAYQKAFKEFRQERDSGGADNYSTLKDFLTDRGDDAASTQARVEFIREYAGHSTVDDDDGSSLPDDWDNKYEDAFDPETAEPWKESYLDVPDLWGSTKFEKVETPIEVTKPANLPNLADIKRIQVSVPDSIKSWGEGKSAPTESFTAGGQK